MPPGVYPHKSLPLADRLWRRVVKGEGCWLWQGATNNRGYGLLNDKGRLRLVHRIAWEVQHGPIPTGIQVLHRCDVPRCVRHLFLGTQRDNVNDMFAKDRQYKGRLTDSQVAEIQELMLPQKEIAARYGISQPYVSQLRIGYRRCR